MSVEMPSKCAIKQAAPATERAGIELGNRYGVRIGGSNSSLRQPVVLSVSWFSACS